MTVRFLMQWNGYSPDAIRTFSDPEETRLVSLGFASFDLDGAAEDMTQRTIKHAAEHAAMNDSMTASRILTVADSGKVLKCTHATVAIVLTVENDATSGWSANEAVAAYQGGAAAVSFAAGAGVTLRGTAPTATQYSTIGVHRVGDNEWAYL